MDEEKQKESFAIRWRERYIRELTEALEGREQEAKLLAALFKCLLVRLAEKGTRESDVEDGMSVRIGKGEVSKALGRYRALVGEEAGAYRVTIATLEALPGSDA